MASPAEIQSAIRVALVALRKQEHIISDQLAFLSCLRIPEGVGTMKVRLSLANTRAAIKTFDSMIDDSEVRPGIIFSHAGDVEPDGGGEVVTTALDSS